MFANGVFSFNRIVSHRHQQRYDAHQPADMLFRYAARVGRNAGGQSGEKMAVVLLHIGVPVGARSGHEIHQTFEPGARLVALSGADEAQKLSRQLDVQSVFPGLEKLVVMDALLSPITGLIVQDVGFWAGRSDRG